MVNDGEGHGEGYGEGYGAVWVCWRRWLIYVRGCGKVMLEDTVKDMVNLCQMTRLKRW